MTTATIVIDRTSLSKPDLTISDTGTTYRLADNGLGRPVKSLRVTAMPDSPDIHGSEDVAVVLEDSALPLTFFVNAASAADLEAALDDLDEALYQLSYTVTVTVGGVARKWRAKTSTWAPVDGLRDPSREAQFFDVVTTSIRIYPIPVTP